VSNPFDIAGRRILVTGASSGIGRETARLLAQLGARVCITGRHAGRLQESLASLQGEGHSASPFDLGNVDAIPAWIKALAAKGNSFDGLAHCAGINDVRPLRSSSWAEVEAILHTNVGACFGMARGFRQRGVHASGASLVFMSSVYSLTGQAGVSAYSASKGAVNSLTRCLAVELAPDTIRVNAVAAGYVDTPMTRKTSGVLTDEQRAAIEKQHILGIAQPGDVTASIAFLLSPAARWITGSVLTVDGGYTAR